MSLTNATLQRPRPIILETTMKRKHQTASNFDDDQVSKRRVKSEDAIQSRFREDLFGEAVLDQNAEQYAKSLP